MATPMDFFYPKFKPILTDQKECVCTYCCCFITEGNVSNHQKKFCPYRPDHNKSGRYRKIALLICVDDGMKCLFHGILNLIKFSDPTILPIVLFMNDDLSVINKQFSQFQWRKQHVRLDVIILSSIDYDYDPPRNQTKEFNKVHHLFNLMDFAGFEVKKNMLYCCVGTGDVLSYPFFCDLQIEWNHIGTGGTMNNFLYVFLPDLYQCFPNTDNCIIQMTSFIKCYLSPKTKPVINHNPLKLTTKFLKRNELLSKDLPPEPPKLAKPQTTQRRSKKEPSIDQQPKKIPEKVTQCYYCNTKFSIAAIKKHEKTCEHRFVDFVDAEFIVLIGIIGKTKHLGSVYAHFIHHYFPKAFISYFFVNNINELVTDVQNASFNRLKFFNESSKGRMFIFTFQQIIPRYDDLLPFFDKYENLVHVHQVVCAPVNEILYDYTKMTPNTSLVFFNETRELVKVINMLTLCEKTDSGSFYQFQPFLAFMSDSNKADTTPQPPQIRSLPSKRSFNQRETLKITVKDLGDLFKMNKK